MWGGEVSFPPTAASCLCWPLSALVSAHFSTHLPQHPAHLIPASCHNPCPPWPLITPASFALACPGALPPRYLHTPAPAHPDPLPSLAPAHPDPLSFLSPVHDGPSPRRPWPGAALTVSRLHRGHVGGCTALQEGVADQVGEEGQAGQQGAHGCGRTAGTGLSSHHTAHPPHMLGLPLCPGPGPPPLTCAIRKVLAVCVPQPPCALRGCQRPGQEAVCRQTAGRAQLGPQGAGRL